MQHSKDKAAKYNKNRLPLMGAAAVVLGKGSLQPVGCQDRDNQHGYGRHHQNPVSSSTTNRG